MSPTAAGQRLTRGSMLGYSVGAVGTAGFGTVPGLLLAIYLTNTLGVAAGIASLVVLLPKLWDVFFLPVVGNLSDRSVARTGNRSRFLVFGAIGMLVCFPLMFAAGLDLGGREQLVGRLSEMARDPASPATVLVTHHVEEIPSDMTHALLVRGGTTVAQGPLDHVLTNEALSATYGLPLDVRRRDGRWTARALSQQA